MKRIKTIFPILMILVLFSSCVGIYEKESEIVDKKRENIPSVSVEEVKEMIADYEKQMEQYEIDYIAAEEAFGEEIGMMYENAYNEAYEAVDALDAEVADLNAAADELEAAEEVTDEMMQEAEAKRQEANQKAEKAAQMREEADASYTAKEEEIGIKAEQGPQLEKPKVPCIIDVRQKNETAHKIDIAVEIPRGILEMSMNDTSLFYAKGQMPPVKESTEIIIYCKSDARSVLAAESLIQLGYENVKYLKGGYNAFNPEAAEAKADAKPAGGGGCGG
jgi:rhodanese-related sulfurtransferase/outer membrane murein-binding lipoprotein Lpp